MTDGPQVRQTDSPMDVFPDDAADEAARRRRTRWTTWGGLGAVLLLAALYVGAAWAWADRVPTGARVAGVEIGGLDADGAVARLSEELEPVTDEPIPVVAGDRRTTLDPRTAGLALDAEATVGQVTGFGLEPVRLWRHLFGAEDVTPVTQVDEAQLGDAVEALDDSLAVAPVDGEILLVDGEVETTPAEEGTELDAEAAAQTLVDQWLVAAPPIELPVRPVPPAIDDAAVQRAVTDLARPLVRAPVVVRVGEARAELPPDILAANATFEPQDGELLLRLDGEVLVEAVRERTTDVLTDPVDARFVFTADGPTIEAGTPGSTLDPEALADAVVAAVTGEERTAEVPLVPVDPEQGVAELEALGVSERVAYFSTPLTPDADRNHNLTLGASRVNGTLLRPDEVFSLTDTLAPITEAGGYRASGVVVGGVLQKGVGGGLSQMGTTIYNVGFFAGLEDVEHQPHSYWFSRYPEGREATIYDGVLDVKIGNNTPYGVLLQSWVADGRLHAAAWSTPHWTVETWTSGRSDVVQPKTVYNEAPDCISQSAGNPGFRVTVTRQIFLDGELQETEQDSHRYQPQNAIVCGPDPADAPRRTPSPEPTEGD